MKTCVALWILLSVAVCWIQNEPLCYAQPTQRNLLLNLDDDVQWGLLKDFLNGKDLLKVNSAAVCNKEIRESKLFDLSTHRLERLREFARTVRPFLGPLIHLPSSPRNGLNYDFYMPLDNVTQRQWDEIAALEPDLPTSMEAFANEPQLLNPDSAMGLVTSDDVHKYLHKLNSILTNSTPEVLELFETDSIPVARLANQIELDHAAAISKVPSPDYLPPNWHWSSNDMKTENPKSWTFSPERRPVSPKAESRDNLRVDGVDGRPLSFGQLRALKRLLTNKSFAMPGRSFKNLPPKPWNPEIVHSFTLVNTDLKSERAITVPTTYDPIRLVLVPGTESTY